MSEAVLYGTLEDVLAGAEAEDNSLGAFGLRARVIIHNKSTRTLQYKTCGTESSYFYTASRRGFNSNFEIESGKAGGFLQYRSFSGLSIIANERCKGYLSLTVPCDGKDYVAVLAWCRFQIGRNKAGIQIRSETGVTDAAGNIAGHGVDPTGVVTSLDDALTVSVAGQNAESQRFSEQSRSFKVTCEFDNGWENSSKRKRTIVFTFEDV